MHRSRPRRASTRRGRSREASPTIGNGDNVQGPTMNRELSDNVAPPPRRSARTRRGTPTPPPARSDPPAHDETDTFGDGSTSQALHVTKEPNKGTSTRMERDDKDDKELGPDESERLELVDEANVEPRQSLLPPSDTELKNTNNRNEQPETASHTSEENTDAKEESSRQDIPTVTQEDGTASGSNAAGEHISNSTERIAPTGSNNAKPNHSRVSRTTNGLGDDQARHENGNGNRDYNNDIDAKLPPGIETSKEHHLSRDASVPLGVGDVEDVSGNKDEVDVRSECEVTFPTNDEKNDTSTESSTESAIATTVASEVTEERTVTSLQAESQTVSLGSKSAMELNDTAHGHQGDALHTSTSPQVSLDSLSENQDMPNKSRPVEERREGNTSPPSRRPDAKGKDHSNEQTVKLGFKTDPRGSGSEQPVQENRTTSEVASVDVSDSNRRITAASGPIGDESNSVLQKRTNPICTAAMPNSDQSSKESSGPLFPSQRSSPTPTARQQQQQLLQQRRNASTTAVTRHASDTRSTVKAPSSTDHFSGGSSENSNERPIAVENRENASSNATSNRQRDGDIPLVSRKRRLDYYADDTASPGPVEARPEMKRQRNEHPETVASTRQRDSTRSHASANGDATAGNDAAAVRASRLFRSDVSNVESVKIRLYDIARRIHRGKGPERMFAAYWGSLSRFLCTQLHQRSANSGGHSSLTGIQEVLDSFLATKQMRKLHNLLIMGLLGECTRDSVKEESFRDYVPEEWYERLRTRTASKSLAAKDTSLPLVSADYADPCPDIDLSDFSLSSDLWTSAGGGALTSRNYFENGIMSGLFEIQDMSQVRRQSPCLPGALVVDPLVRRIVRENHLKVSETAIWLIIVAVREYVESVVKATVTNLATVEKDQSLGPIEFAQNAIRSGNMKEQNAGMKEENKGSSEKIVEAEDNVPPKEMKTDMQEKFFAGAKRRRITSLDIASTLNGSRMSAESLAGSVTNLAYKRCCHFSFLGIQPSQPPALDSVLSFVVHGIESAAKKRKHEWHDPVPIAAVAPTVEYPSPPPPTKPSPRTSGDVRSNNDRSPICGLGKEAKDLAALKARAVATAAAAGTTQPTHSSFTSRPPLPNKPAEDELPESNDCSGTPPSPTTTGGRHSSSVSPRGKGKGFGVKDLAAIRARSKSFESSSSTPPKKQAAVVTNITSPSKNKSSPQSNGKELRRLEQVQGQNIVTTEAKLQSSPRANVNPKGSEATATTTAAAGMIPALPEAMDTTTH